MIIAVERKKFQKCYPIEEFKASRSIQTKSMLERINNLKERQAGSTIDILEAKHRQSLQRSFTTNFCNQTKSTFLPEVKSEVQYTPINSTQGLLVGADLHKDKKNLSLSRTNNNFSSLQESRVIDFGKRSMSVSQTNLRKPKPKKLQSRIENAIRSGDEKSLNYDFVYGRFRNKKATKPLSSYSDLLKLDGLNLKAGYLDLLKQGKEDELLKCLIDPQIGKEKKFYITSRKDPFAKKGMLQSFNESQTYQCMSYTQELEREIEVIKDTGINFFNSTMSLIKDFKHFDKASKNVVAIKPIKQENPILQGCDKATIKEINYVFRENRERVLNNQSRILEQVESIRLQTKQFKINKIKDFASVTNSRIIQANLNKSAILEEKHHIMEKLIDVKSLEYKGKKARERKKISTKLQKQQQFLFLANLHNFYLCMTYLIKDRQQVLEEINQQRRNARMSESIQNYVKRKFLREATKKLSLTKINSHILYERIKKKTLQRSTTLKMKIKLIQRFLKCLRMKRIEDIIITMHSHDRFLLDFYPHTVNLTDLKKSMLLDQLEKDFDKTMKFNNQIYQQNYGGLLAIGALVNSHVGNIFLSNFEDASAKLVENPRYLKLKEVEKIKLSLLKLAAPQNLDTLQAVLHSRDSIEALTRSRKTSTVALDDPDDKEYIHPYLGAMKKNLFRSSEMLDTLNFQTSERKRRWRLKPITFLKHSILAYSSHANFVFFPPALHYIFNYSIFKSSENKKEEVAEIDRRAKYRAILKLYRKRLAIYVLEFRAYIGNLQNFAADNDYQVKVLRADHMLRMNPEKLSKIMEQEKKQKKIQRDKGYNIPDDDYLPFAHKKLKFAEQLPDAPSTPIFNREFTEGDFEELTTYYRSELTVSIEEYKAHIANMRLINKRKRQTETKESTL